MRTPIFRTGSKIGIHEQLIQKAVEDGIDTIVTCDNGIAASAEIADAKERGLTVVITDHHDIPFQETENGKEWIYRRQMR